jgi:hypothetical protein
MGIRASNHFQTDRPESGGTDHNAEHENSGLLARDKQRVSAEEAAKQRSSKRRASAESKTTPAQPNVNPATRNRHR